MKNEEMLLAMNLIDDKFIEEAAPKKRNIGFRIAMVAALAVFLSLLAYLFIPFRSSPPSVREYKDSEYYEIIQKLNEFAFEKPKYANNLDRLLSSMILSQNAPDKPDHGNTMTEGSDTEGSISFEDPESFSKDIIPPAVNTGDIALLGDGYLYYDYDKKGYLSIYSLDGESSKRVKRYILNYEANAGVPHKLHLSSDQKTLSVVSYYRSKEWIEVLNAEGYPYEKEISVYYCRVTALDVSDPKNITERSSVVLRADYLTSAQVNGKIILAASYRPKDIDFSDPSTFVPMIATGGEFEPIPAKYISAPEKLTSTKYTVLLMLDENDLALTDIRALLSESSDICVTAESIYTTRTLTAEQKSGENTIITPYTVITRIPYSENGFGRVAANTLEGQILSHNFLAESDGVLYAVTKTSLVSRHNKLPIYSCCMCMHRETLIATNANIYRLDPQSMEILSTAEDLCRIDLPLASVLYANGYAHLSFSSSDGKSEHNLSVDLNTFTVLPAKPSEKTSSVPFDLGGGYIFTIRTEYESFKNPKETVVEVFMTDDSGQSSVASLVIPKADCSYWDWIRIDECICIDRTLGLIGFGIERKQYEGEEPDGYDADGYPEFSEDRYLLLQFKDGSLSLLLDVPLAGSNHLKRAFYRDGYLYAATPDDFIAVPVELK